MGMFWGSVGRLLRPRAKQVLRRWARRRRRPVAALRLRCDPLALLQFRPLFEGDVALREVHAST